MIAFVTGVHVWRECRVVRDICMLLASGLEQNDQGNVADKLLQDTCVAVAKGSEDTRRRDRGC